MITGCLQKKNGYYYAVLYLKVDGKRKPKWISTKLPVSTTSERKAQKALDEIRMQYERQEEANAKAAEAAAQGCPPEAQMRFVDYMGKWLDSVRPSIATATYQSYSIMMKAWVIPYFTKSAVLLGALTPQHIEEFYQTILNDGCTTNTVIHYHAIIRKALQSAVKKDILAKNPADQVDWPKKNVYHGSFYSESEMLTLCVDEGGKLLRPNYVTEHFGRILRKYGPRKIRFHDIRHPYVKPTTKKFITFFEVFRAAS